jgi:hypothetical protein
MIELLSFEKRIGFSSTELIPWVEPVRNSSHGGKAGDL